MAPAWNHITPCKLKAYDVGLTATLIFQAYLFLNSTQDISALLDYPELIQTILPHFC